MRRISELALNPNGFAFDPTFGESFLLNATGLFALRAIVQGDPYAAAQQIAEAYGISEAEALSDLFEFMAKLRILGFEVE